MPKPTKRPRRINLERQAAPKNLSSSSIAAEQLEVPDQGADEPTMQPTEGAETPPDEDAEMSTDGGDEMPTDEDGEQQSNATNSR